MPRSFHPQPLVLVAAWSLLAAACTDRDPVAPPADVEPDAAFIGSTVGTTFRGGSNYTTVDVGSMHTCHVTASSFSTFTSGDCFGSAQQYTPSDPYNLTLVQGTNFPGRPKAVSVGMEHSCAIDLYDNAWCWGRDNRGQLGFGGTYTIAGYPGMVVGNHLYSAISAGGSHSCGVDLAGAAWCWGDNTYGQLGNMSQGETSASPVQVAGGHVFRSISAGQFHSCGITTSQALLCWGLAREGQLGVSPVPGKACVPTMYLFMPFSTECATSPVQVQSGTQYAMVSAGFTHSCAVTTAGAAFCWGTNGSGELGDGYFTGTSTGNRFTPVAVYGGHTFANVSAGMDYTCGVTTSGRGYCWGDNSHGKTGYGAPVSGSYNSSREPKAVQTTYTFASISAGFNHSCGVTPWDYYGNTLLCWGNNYYGQLGDGTWDTRATPVVSRGW
jgi:alpha-tubulin suppressor-like RCC1 family protein